MCYALPRRAAPHPAAQHPGHARKLVRKLNDMGKAATYYYENIEGGHGGAADNKQSAFMSVLAYEFLERVPAGGELGGGKARVDN